jgi:hypothetical protein
MMETESGFEISADLNKLTQLSARVYFNVHSNRDSQINWSVNMNHRVSPHGGGIIKYGTLEGDGVYFGS